MSFRLLCVALAAWLAMVGPALAAGNSGFLDDYSRLAPDPDRAGALRYVAPGVDLAKYDKLLITPIEVLYAPDSKHKNISPDELKTITDRLYAALIAALEPAIPVVSQPGPGVLAVRLAITGVRLENKKRSLLGYTPIGFAATTLANAAGLRVTLKGAALEAELLDAQTGETLGQLVDEGAATTAGGDGTSWEQLDATMTFYAQRFRSRFAPR